MKNKFKDYCTPRENEVFERGKFFEVELTQASGELVYRQVCSCAAFTCEGLVSATRPSRSLGCVDARVKERLLREDSPTLKSTLDNLSRSRHQRPHWSSRKRSQPCQLPSPLCRACVNGSTGVLYARKVDQKRPNLDGPEYALAQNKMAGVHVHRKIISRHMRFDNHSSRTCWACNGKLTLQ